MYNFSVILSLLSLCISSNLITCGWACDCPNYYWRDWTGTVPKDAFVGAEDSNGPLYVGQVFYRDWDLLPATVYPNTGLAVTSAFNNYLKTNKYVKVLASPDNDMFEWIPIKSEDLHLYENRAVPGGSEVNQDIFIGRTKHENEYMFGKIFKHDQGNRGLWLKRDGKPETNFVSYDLLVYNCNKTKTNTSSSNSQNSGHRRIHVSVEEN